MYYTNWICSHIFQMLYDRHIIEKSWFENRSDLKQFKNCWYLRKARNHRVLLICEIFYTISHPLGNSPMKFCIAYTKFDVWSWNGRNWIFHVWNKKNRITLFALVLEYILSHAFVIPKNLFLMNLLYCGRKNIFESLPRLCAEKY